MVEDRSTGRRLFVIGNYLFLIGLAVTCVLPLIHILAISFSSSAAASANMVRFWPIDFTTASYDFVLSSERFYQSLWVSVQRVVLGVLVNMVLTVLVAYPLSKEVHVFRWRTAYAWFFVLTTLINGGLITTYLVVRQTGLLDTIWSLILPGAVPVFNVVLLMNFFRTLPRELEEAALIDGAGHWTVLWRIYLPLSTPALATICLFVAVGHWNEWFSGLIYMNSQENYPLQSYIRQVIASTDPIALARQQDFQALRSISDRTVKAAQIFLAALPILLVYPFLQRYFVGGLVLGSVKE
jgi:putative aldouronate transport system permease protein